MGHTSMSQHMANLGAVVTLFKAVGYCGYFDGLSTKLIIIFIIGLGIWVIRASGNLGSCSMGVIITLT